MYLREVYLLPHSFFLLWKLVTHSLCKSRETSIVKFSDIHHSSSATIRLLLINLLFIRHPITCHTVNYSSLKIGFNICLG